MSYRLCPFGSSRVLDRLPGLGRHARAFVVACAMCLLPFAASAAAFTVTPANLVFGSVPLGATATMAVTITNTSGVSQTPSFAGGAPFDSVNFGGFQNCAGVTLAPGASCKFTYQFHPTTLGAKSSSTTIGINSENFSITMSGTGISAFSVAPANLVFGSVPLGATATMAVTITNTSGVSQTPSFAGGAPFDSVNFGGFQNCAGVTLAPGASCKFTYQFHPTTLGAKSSSTTIGINSENFSITMSGTGIGVSAITVAPTTIDFGSVLVDTTVAMITTVTNVSGAPLGPLSVAGGAPEAPFGATQSCAGVTLAAGGTCKFFYTFTPTAPGPASSSSNFTINGQAFSVSLSGSGTSLLNLNQHGLTGSWYEPATDGQGIEVEVYPDLSPGMGSIFVSWFTYDAVSGGADHQRWYTAQGPVATGQPNAALTIYQNTGGNFNAPPITSAQPVGTASLSFDTCTSGQLSYIFTDGTGRTGNIPLTRITQNVTCSATAPYPTNSDFALSGNWYEAATSGQGFTVEVNPISGAFFATWYTYVPIGTTAGVAGQRWYTAQGAFTPGVRSIPVTIYETTGGMFDQPTPPGQNTVPVGTATMAFQSCSAATFAYNFSGGTSMGLSGIITFSRVGPTPQDVRHEAKLWSLRLGCASTFHVGSRASGGRATHRFSVVVRFRGARAAELGSPLSDRLTSPVRNGLCSRTLSQFALKRTRMTFLSYSASVCIVISTPPAA